MEEKQIRDLVASALAEAMVTAGEQFQVLATTASEKAVSDLTARFEALDGTIKALPKPLDAEALKGIVTAQIAETAKAGEGDKAKGKIIDARNAFLAASAGKLPRAYQAMIPETADDAALKAGLDAATAAFQADVADGKKFGIQAVSLGAGAPGDAAGGVKLDPEKMNPVQKIAAGLAEKA